MKNALTTAVTAIMLMFCCNNAMALDPDQCGKPRGRYTNIGFSYAKLNQDGYPKLHSDIGVSLSKGTTYFLHKPIAGCLRFGIDATWFDLTYNNYKVKEIYTDEVIDYSIHHVDLGLQAGVSATVNLFKRFQAQAYFRYNPTLALMYNNDEIQAGFANMFNGGVCVSYGVIGIGIENRFGHSKLKSYFQNEDFNPEENPEDWTSIIDSRKVKTKFSDIRAYVSFRF